MSRLMRCLAHDVRLFTKGWVMKNKFWVAAAAFLMVSSAQAAGVVRTFAVSIEVPGPFTWNSSVLSPDVAFNLIGSATSTPYTFASPLVPGGSVTLPALTLSSVALKNALTGASWLDDDLSNGFSFSNLPSGDYFLQVKGLTSPTLGGVFGVVTVGTPAVPEPAALTLALAGLGVAGVAWRRRAAA
jgi:PEP-CTERM motif